MDKTRLDLLIVEDNLPDAEYLQELLSEVREPVFSIVRAERLSEGLAYLDKEHFDIVLLDLGLPDSQGLITASTMRHNAPRIPIVVLTGLNDEQTGLQALQMDIQDYLIKGQFKQDLLVRSIRYAIERKRNTTALQDSEELYRATYEKAPVGIELLDFSGRYRQGNGWLNRMLGYTDAELSQLTFMQITHPDDLMTELPLLEKLLANRIPNYSIKKRYLHKEGHPVWVQITSSIARTSNPYRISIIEDITERQRAEAALKESEARLRFVIEHSPDNIFIQDYDLRYLWIARPASPLERENYLGKTDFELGMIVGTGDDVKLLTDIKKRVIREGLPATVEVPLTVKGEVKCFAATYEPWRDSRDTIIGLAGYVRDITARKREEETIKRWAEIFRNTRIGIAVSTPDGLYLELINPAFAEMHGYAIEELTGVPFSSLIAPETQKDLSAIIGKVYDKGYHVQETIHIRKNGTRFPVLINVSAVRDESGTILYRIANVQDITEQKRAEETILYRTYHDLLTGLPNRAQLISKLGLDLFETSRTNNKLALLHIDLDRFRTINESLGHTVGDKIILAVAERLRTFVSKNNTLARIGGDEFIVLQSDLKRPEDAAFLARKVVDLMQKSFRIDDHDLYVTASIGISIYPEDSKNAEVLLRNADIAVSQVKESGRNSFQFFNPAINTRTVERLLLESDLRNAIERAELELYYQPQVNIKTGKIIALEALVRWNHPVLGLLPPSRFIPVAEEIGIIGAIDVWVLRTACMQNKMWQNTGFPYLCVTVNLSTQQFQQASLIEMTHNILLETDLAPRYLDIEITEGTAMSDIDVAVPNLKGLHDMGVDLSIDDFGTGYSSLSYLKRFPVHKLKIDQSFIRGIPGDLDSQAIVNAMVAMGHNLHLRVIAEGVETLEQLAFLRENDCDEMQGFLVSEPLSAGKTEELLGKKSPS